MQMFGLALRSEGMALFSEAALSHCQSKGLQKSAWPYCVRQLLHMQGRLCITLSFNFVNAYCNQTLMSMHLENIKVWGRLLKHLLLV